MSEPQEKFSGLWLHDSNRRGEQFSHHEGAYEHDGDDAGEGATAMRHAFVEQEGGKVGVWVPADWSDEQAREALESNW